ncbi:hypothetical protein PBY51_018650 [Eleginops maclovinus]|uniref:3-beta hydroxysteroid dehydrogenase/isomerase domain-containing protein n=1 Tax=Eleginops maclovinus TaxID=56733 RepID=A0AAN7YAB7_ELEMC|nr:hypothetical protein PBY51_018650 [Eleginops maclovinus]
MNNARTDTFLITGGCGYFGYRLACSLHKKGAKIILFDTISPKQELPEDIVFVQGDIREYAQVEKAIAGVDCVFHLASYGMSGREQLNRHLIEAVNVQGTQNVLQACIEHGVSGSFTPALLTWCSEAK